jgi:hypothetical protein
MPQVLTGRFIPAALSLAVSLLTALPLTASFLTAFTRRQFHR